MRSITGIVTLLALSFAAGAQTIPDNVGKSSSGLPAQLQNVGFEPQLNAQLPLDLNFRDESGRDVQLREYFGRKPVLLALVYYGCPMLCNQVEMGVVGTLKMLTFNAGRDYDVVFVSFDPRETPLMAAKKKEAALSHYGRPEAASGWHFLTGKEEAIHALTAAANFRYSFEYPSRDVRLGLVDASAGKIGTPIDHLLLFCFQYNPETARYSATVLRIVRLGGVLTIFAIVVGIVIFRRRDVRAASATSRPPLQGGSEQGAH